MNVLPGRIKILFVLPSLLIGGAERVTLNLVRAIDRDRFEPVFALLRYEGGLLENVPPDVPIYPLGATRMRFAWIPLVSLIKDVQPDIVYSVLDHTNLNAILAVNLAACLGHQSGLICSSHNTLSHIPLPWWVSLLLKILIPKLYPIANRVIVISEGAKRDLARLFPNLGNLQMIHNPAFDDSLFQMAQEPVDHPWLGMEKTPLVVGCGSLIPVKGFQYLLEAIAICSQHIQCRTLIVGDGPERPTLEILAKQLHIDEHVRFLGHVANPFKYLARADLFVHTSLSDGLPTVLIEAMACGTPVIATDCPSGPAEIVTDGVDGCLVSPPGDANVLAQAIMRLLEDRNLAARLAEQGQQRAKAFHASQIVKKYERVFEEVALEVSNSL